MLNLWRSPIKKEKKCKRLQQGITLTELLVALVISSIVLTAGTSGFINLLKATSTNDSKGTRNSTIQKALLKIQNDIRSGKQVNAEAIASSVRCPNTFSGNCLTITLPNNNYIVYAFKDISTGDQIFLKPGLLQRQEFNNLNNPILINGQSTAWETEYTAIADGLISINEGDQVVNCSENGTQWTNSTSYGNFPSTNKGGFRFCLTDNTANNKLARVYLFGHVIGSTTVIKSDIVAFSRSQ